MDKFISGLCLPYDYDILCSEKSFVLWPGKVPRSSSSEVRELH